MYRGATDSNIKIVTSNLVCHLDASQLRSYGGTGTAWNDLSGNNENFTLYNSPTFTNIYGGELRFDGINDYARRRSSGVINSIAANGTVEIWYRSYDGGVGGGSYSRLISVASDAGTGSDTTSTLGSNIDYSTFFCLAQNNGTAYYNIWYKNGPAPFGGTATYNDNIYRQIIFTWSTSGANMTFTHYLNSINQLSTTYTQSAFTGANNITIGMNCNGAVSLTSENNKGAYSIVRLYSKTLSQAEITQNFNANRTKFGI